MTEQEVKDIKDSIAYWANNCGGCETCHQIFGNREEPTFDMQTVWEIINFFEIKLTNSLKEK